MRYFFLSIRYLSRPLGIVDALLTELLPPAKRTMIEIKPYGFEENGRKFYAECFPYIRGIPIPAIAHCQYCTLYSPDTDEICLGWRDNPEHAPSFCGPVCHKFDLVGSRRRLLEKELSRSGRYRKTLWRLAGRRNSGSAEDSLTW